MILHCPPCPHIYSLSFSFLIFSNVMRDPQFVHVGLCSLQCIRCMQQNSSMFLVVIPWICDFVLPTDTCKVGEHLPNVFWNLGRKGKKMLPQIYFLSRLQQFFQDSSSTLLDLLLPRLGTGNLQDKKIDWVIICFLCHFIRLVWRDILSD